MRNRILVVFIVSLAVSVLTSMSVFRSQGQTNSTFKQEAATPVQEGVMSKTQKKHSKLYKDYRGIGKIHDLIRQDGHDSDELTLTVLPGSPELVPEGESKTSACLIDDLADKADAVVIGIVTAKESQLTEEGTFVFTDYVLRVEEVLKDNGKAPIGPQASLTLTRPGGKILLNGRTVTVVDKSFGPMMAGRRYLLFVKYIAETGTYQSTSANAGFELIDNTAMPLTEAPSESRNERSVDSFLRDVRLAIALSQSNKGEKK